jgi:hypothetical protein
LTGKYYSQILLVQPEMGRKLKFSPREDESVRVPLKLLAVSSRGDPRCTSRRTDGATQETAGIARGFAEEVMLKRSAAEL